VAFAEASMLGKTGFVVVHRSLLPGSDRLAPAAREAVVNVDAGSVSRPIGSD
jgi:hypothetical protein